MKSQNRSTATQLADLLNIGTKIADKLSLINIHQPQDLIGKDAYKLYDELCRITGKKHDSCVIDVFLSVVDFMNGDGEAKPWWNYTKQRKKHFENKQ